MSLAISRNYTSTDSDLPLNDDQKIVVFIDKVRGWYLQIADGLDTAPHAGFGLLLLVTAYYEFIAQCLNGSESNRQSTRFFKQGFVSVYGKDAFTDAQLGRIYRELRCGLFHAVFPKPTVVISGGFDVAFEFEGKALKINPHKALDDIRRHFSRYCLAIYDRRGRKYRQICCSS